MRKLSKIIGLLGIACLLALLFSQPAGQLRASYGYRDRRPATSPTLTPIRELIPPSSPVAAVKKALSLAIKESTQKRETGKVSQAPKVARFALPAGLSPAALGVIVKKCADEQGVDEDLVWAVIRQESGGDPWAVSPKGAMGLMQLMPGTAAYLGVKDPFDVEQNIQGGIQYLLECLNRFKQDVSLALAAYNAGPGNVVKYNGIPPFAETRNYVKAVMQVYHRQWRPPGLEDDDESLFSGRITGLHWRIPHPKWKVIEPQVKIPSPRWKEEQRPS